MQDSEIALHLYHQRGMQVAPELRGEFSVIIADEREQIMVAIDQKEEETHIVEEKVEEPIDLKVDPPVMSIFQISSTGLMTLIFD